MTSNSNITGNFISVSLLQMTKRPSLSFLFLFFPFCYFRFNDELGSEKKILPQYDDPVKDEVCSSLTYSEFCLSYYLMYLSDS